MALSRRFRGFLRPVFTGTLVLFTGVSGVTEVSGCLNRPLEPNEPKITSTVQEKLPQSKINKIDLLLMIDNSASMGDKQAILASAVPDLVRGLVSPRAGIASWSIPSPTTALESRTESPSSRGSSEPMTDQQDPTNLRCFDQKRRFGIDFLYPLDRYTSALTSATVPNRADDMVPDPLFPKPDAKFGVHSPRTAEGGLVFMAGIVGVPWQDIARRNADGKPDLRAGLDASQTRGGTLPLVSS